MRLAIGPGPVGAKPFDVVGLGEHSVDFIARADTFPEPDTKSAIHSLVRMPGGQTTTALVACARLGWRAAYLGPLDTADPTRLIEHALAHEGVDVTRAVRVPAPPRSAIILVDGRGRRTILGHHDPALRIDPSDVQPLDVTSGRVLMIDAEHLDAATEAARIARGGHVPVVLDVEHVVPGVEALARLADVIVAGRAFAGRYTGQAETGKAVRALAAATGAALVVVTLGAEGSLALAEGHEIRTPAFVVPVVDSTGAGDAFRGGFVSAWLGAGAGADPAALLEYGAAVAALKCRAAGSQAGLPNSSEVRALLTTAGSRRSNKPVGDVTPGGTAAWEPTQP